MSKRALSLCLVVLLTVFAAMTSLRAFAEDDRYPDNLIESQTVPSQTVEPTTEEIIPADFPALTVNAISNYFPTAVAEYNAATEEVVVTYWINLGMRVLSMQWYLIYDPGVLTFSKEKNTVQSICPSAVDGAVLSRTDADTIRFCASNPALFDFSGKLTPFAQVVFEVNGLNPNEPETTKIDLMVDMLRVSEADPSSGFSDPKRELSLVSNSDIVPYSGLTFVKADRTTTLSPSNFVQATTAPPKTTPQGYFVNTPDEVGESVPSSSVPSTASPTLSTDPPASVQPVTTPASPPDSPGGASSPGSPGTAFIVLGAFIAATSVLFVMRKKEILY